MSSFGEDNGWNFGNEEIFSLPEELADPFFEPESYKEDSNEENLKFPGCISQVCYG